MKRIHAKLTWAFNIWLSLIFGTAIASLMKPQFSRTLSILMGQLLLNMFLASWLYTEYVHNPFMQQYISSFWATNTTTVSIAVVLGGVVAGGSFLAIWKRHDLHLSTKPSQETMMVNANSPGGLTVLDVCPFCNVPLKALSENRFQCRKCRRFFKK